MLGLQPQPTVIEVVAYLAYAIPMGLRPVAAARVGSRAPGPARRLALVARRRSR